MNHKSFPNGCEVLEGGQVVELPPPGAEELAASKRRWATEAFAIQRAVRADRRFKTPWADAYIGALCDVADGDNRNSAGQVCAYISTNRVMATTRIGSRQTVKALRKMFEDLGYTVPQMDRDGKIITTKEGAKLYALCNPRSEQIKDEMALRLELIREEDAERRRQERQKKARRLAVGPMVDLTEFDEGANGWPGAGLTVDPYSLEGTTGFSAKEREAFIGGTNNAVPVHILPKSSKIEAENKNSPPAENFGEWLDGAPQPVAGHLPTFGRPAPRNEYAAARDVDELDTPFPVPADQAEAEYMIDQMCGGVEINPRVRRHIVRFLEDGRLTPKLFNGMINPPRAGAA